MAKDVKIIISAESKEAEQVFSRVSKSLNGLERQVSVTSDRTAKSFNKIGIGAISMGNLIALGIAKGLQAMTSSLDGAVKRLDTINNYPKVMSNLGIGAEASRVSIEKLSNELQGLPTTLDDAVGAVQRFTSANQNVEASTEMFLALNNAILAGGAPMINQQSALEQLSQAYAKGRPDMMEWRTAMTAMPAQLMQVANAMGFVGSAQLGEALTTGKVSMQEFMNTITRLNREGANGFKSFSEQARNSTGGVGTSMILVKTAIVRGLADIMNAIGQANIAEFFQWTARVIGAVASNIVGFVKIMIQAFQAITAVVGSIVGYVRAVLGLGSASKTTATATEKTATNMASTAGSVERVADGLGGANKEAKKLSKQLSGFDEMNVLQEQNTGSSSGTGVNGIDLSGMEGIGDAIGDLSGLTDAINGVNGALFELTPAQKIIAGIVTALIGMGATVGVIRLVSAFLRPIIAVGAGVASAFRLIGGVLGGVVAWVGTVITAIGEAGLGAALRTAFLWIGRIIQRFGLIGLAIGTVIIGITELIANWDTVVKWFGDVFNAIGGFFASVVQAITLFVAQVATNIANFFAPIFNFFNEVAKVIGQILWSVVILVVALFAIMVESIYKFVIKPLIDYFVGLWNGIVEKAKIVWEGIVKIFGAITSWLDTNVIQPVGKFFTDLWNGIVTGVGNAWNGIVKFLSPVTNWIDKNIIKPVTTLFISVWNTISNGVTVAVNVIKSVMGTVGNWLNTYVINPVKSFFAGLWNGIIAGVTNAINVVKTVFNTIVNNVKLPFNFIVDGINGVLRGLNKIKVPDWVPNLGGQSPNFPMIPRLARGGVVDRATMAVIGEAGREAVVPLENNTGWIDEIASKLNMAGGGGASTIIVKIGEETIATKIVDAINNRSMMSGQNAIIV